MNDQKIKLALSKKQNFYLKEILSDVIDESEYEIGEVYYCVYCDGYIDSSRRQWEDFPHKDYCSAIKAEKLYDEFGYNEGGK